MSSTVLLAEDDWLIAMNLLDELGEAGFEVAGPFAHIGDALAYCAEHTPDCAVLDFRLADGDSFPIADLLTQKLVPIIFHSGDAQPRMLLGRYPETRICPKPAQPCELARMVADACAHASA